MKPVKMNELALDHHFWNKVSDSEEFRRWLLDKTEFTGRDLELVRDEKWHQRWYVDPKTKMESEGDILLFFVDKKSRERYTLHIENKPPHGKFRPFQPENYKKRAIDRMTAWNYVKFQTILLAPMEFIARYPGDVRHFDIAISYEEVSTYIPEFSIPNMKPTKNG